MARLDVYKLADEIYVVDVQANLLDRLDRRVVVPLVPRETSPAPIKELNPVFEIFGQTFVMQTQALANIPTRELRHPVASLDRQHDAITRALDILLLGY
jgi:toxin CcdB